MTEFTESEEKILNEYYPPRTGKLGDDGNEETGEWSWEGWEHDEVIPWTFSSSDGVGEEEFLALYNAWNANQSISITEINRLGHVTKANGFRDGEEMDSYEYIVMLEQRSVWRISINENMGLHGIWCIQKLPKQIRNVDIQIRIQYEDYWDPNASLEKIREWKTQYTEHAETL